MALFPPGRLSVLLAIGLWGCAPTAPPPEWACAPQAVSVAGAPLVGVEDMAIAGGSLVLSAYDRALVEAGSPAPGFHGLAVLALAAVLAADGKAALTARALAGAGLGFPHGMDARDLGEGRAAIAVIDRHYEAGMIAGADLVFLEADLDAAAPQGVEKGRVKDPRLCAANDVALGQDGAWAVSLDRADCAAPLWLSHFPGRASGSILAGDRDKSAGRLVVEGLKLPNGVLFDEAGRLWAAQTRARSLQIFAPTDRGEWEDVQTIALDFAPDNLGRAKDGMWASGGTSLWRFGAYRRGDAARHPWKTMRLSENGLASGPDWRSGTIASATVFVEAEGVLIGGDALGAGLILCRPRAAAAP